MTKINISINQIHLFSITSRIFFFIDSVLFQELKHYLDNAKDGFIYFSLGTNVQSHLLTKEKIRIILETLKELPYKILWKYASDDVPDIPENVKIMKWIPQQDVLSKSLKIEKFEHNFLAS